jgi:hypothetical protein
MIQQHTHLVLKKAVNMPLLSKQNTIILRRYNAVTKWSDTTTK